MRENMGMYRGFHEDKNGDEFILVGKKKIKGDWYYGCLLKDNASGICAIVSYVNLAGDIHDLSEINIHAVIPRTVGYSSGCCDKYEKKVFENDIVWDEYQECYGVVEFDAGEFIVNYDGFVDSERFDDVISCCNITGNIHDYREVIGEGEENA